MDELEPGSRSEWREWLDRNHRSSSGIWLVFRRKSSGRQALSYDDAVEEALCFGWIDSIVKRLDGERFARKMTPRRPGSRWSGANTARAERLAAEGLMTPAGTAAVREGRAPGPADVPPVDGELPPELELLLAQNPLARENFGNLAPYCRRQYTGWIAAGRRAATRERRAREAVALLEKGEKLGLR